MLQRVVRGVRISGGYEPAAARPSCEFMQLMAGLQVDLAAMARAHGQKPALFDAALMALEPLVADGLCRIEGYHVSVTPQARFFVRNIAARLDAYWQPNPGRHSLAV